MASKSQTNAHLITIQNYPQKSQHSKVYQYQGGEQIDNYCIGDFFHIHSATCCLKIWRPKDYFSTLLIGSNTQSSDVLKLSTIEHPLGRNKV